MALMEIPTLCHRLSATAIQHSERPAVSWQAGTTTRTLTWFEYRERVLDLAGGLLRLGVTPGRSVVILTGNRLEHLLTDAAALHCGAIPVSVYPNLATEQIDHILTDCQPALIVIENRRQLHLMRELPWVVNNQPQLVLLDPSAELAPPAEFTWVELLDLGASSRYWVSEELDALIAAIDASTPATLVYTSGTTGKPKGVVITHGNVLSQVESLVRTGTLDYDYRSVSHLPLAQIAERLSSLYLPMRLGGHVFTCPNPDQLVQALHIHRPSFLMTVPRFWEKLRGDAEQVFASPHFAPHRASIDQDRQILRQTAHARLNDQYLPPSQQTAAAHAREGLLRDVRGALGLDQLMFACSGAAPMAHDLRLELASLGIDIHFGYGLTETTGIAASDRLGCRGRDAVGLPMPGTQITIAPDGEILVRAPANTPGYYNGRDMDVFFTEGWLHTGDLGYFDAAGRLHITNRREELLINSAGMYIAPAAIETRLNGASFIDRAIAIGTDRPYIVALLTVDPERLTQFARRNQITETALEVLIAHPQALAEVDTVIEDVNRTLSQPEQIRKYRILAETWSSDCGELTLTSNLRRSVIIDKYRSVIGELYS